MTDWLDPDTIYHNVEFDNVIAFIYDIETMSLFSRKSMKYTHSKLIEDDMDYFYPIFLQTPYAEDVPDQISLEMMRDAGSSIYIDYLHGIRSRLQSEFLDRLVFGRTGFHLKSQKFYYSFWEDYDDRQVNEAILEINSVYKIQYKHELVSRPSGTIPLGQNKNKISKDAEDEARNKTKEKMLAHLMPAAQKKEELFKAGAKPKGINPWRQEAMKLAKGYNEPWRLTSEDKE